MKIVFGDAVKKPID